MTENTLLFLWVGAALWVIGLHGMLVVRHVLRRILAVNIMTSGVFLIMVALAARGPEPDPVLHALVLTGLVISVSATALAVHLATAVFGNRPGESPPQ